MRVGVFLDDIRPEAGGGFTIVHDLADAFCELAGESGHRYVLFSTPEYAEHLLDCRPPHNVSICPMPARGHLGRAVAGLRHYLPVSGYLLRFAGRLERQARKIGVEIVWFVGGFYDTLDIPYISTVWDLQHRTHPWFPEVSADWRWDHRELVIGRHLRRATRLITGTEVGREQIIQCYGIAAETIRILPHPTPAFALRSAEKMGAAKPAATEPTYMLYPAQFWPHKNHVNLLLAWRELLDRGVDAPRLVLAGSDKGNRRYVERWAAKLALTDHVSMPGFVPVQDLIQLYRGAEALVYPSFSGPENLPPLEAFALGCPVMSSEFPGAREQLGDAALYFDPARPGSIADAVVRLRGDPDLRRNLIEAGRSRALRQTARDFVRGVFAILDEFEPQRRCWPAPDLQLH
jgi:glycosyltransferase involved in cell wall biosynthesis